MCAPLNNQSLGLAISSSKGNIATTTIYPPVRSQWSQSLVSPAIASLQETVFCHPCLTQWWTVCPDTQSLYHRLSVFYLCACEWRPLFWLLFSHSCFCVGQCLRATWPWCMCVWYKGGIYSECACVLGRYTVYGEGGCMYSECMYVLGVGVWAELCFSLPNPFF